MRRFIILIMLAGLAVLYLQGQTIVSPSIKSKTSFAIIVDTKSMNEAGNEINAYKKVIEDDGLGAYVISHEWKSPDEIRELILNLYNDKKAPLEGVVFVGDIPIPMLRDAQHLTSAFKMDQKRDWQQSSIASDRFYDDFGLKFDFIKQDSIKPLFFYYSMRADSEHRIKSDIYSARIKPLEKGKKDKYTQLREYLKKVVSVRTTEKNNIIDNLTIARGHGYNSDSRVAWAGEHLAIMEQFPQIFGTGNFIKFMDFDSYWPMKPYWLNEIQRLDLDVMVFHHHGSNDYQYINGYKSGSDMATSIGNIKLYLNSKIRPAVESGKDKEETIKYYMEQYDVPRSWCEEAFDPEVIIKDSLMNEMLDIQVRDILDLSPNARFVMFDACYNGSFYEDEYIAGAYIFNDGKTIVTQGNTVNSLQDKWPDEYLGLLSHGLRIGLLGKYVHFLETHMIGDPTFRFAPNSKVNFNINAALTQQKNNISFWKKALNNPSVDIQAIALRVLYDNDYNDISSLLRQSYFNSPSMIVRMEALLLLSRLNNDDFIDVLSYAASDSYELIKRFALDFITMNGSDKLIPALAKAMLYDDASKRLNFKISMGHRLFNYERLETELKDLVANKPLYDSKTFEALLKAIANGRKTSTESATTMKNKSETVKEIAFEISRYRNQPITENADVLINIVPDKDYDADLRFAAAEALGWFNYSYKRNDIVDKLKNILPSIDDDKISYEVNKTINRLTSK